MASGKPVVRQVAWLSILPQLLIMVVIVLIFTLLIERFITALVVAMITYLAISNILERGIPHNHRKGVLLSKKGDYLHAIEEFQKSYDFFTKHFWIDKYRCITLLSSSRKTYTEMSLVNIAFCYAQTGEIDLTKHYYKKALDLFPDSEMAKSALDMIAILEHEPSNSVTKGE